MKTTTARCGGGESRLSDFAAEEKSPKATHQKTCNAHVYHKMVESHIPWDAYEV